MNTGGRADLYRAFLVCGAVEESIPRRESPVDAKSIPRDMTGRPILTAASSRG
jgi:hypothetical protein